MEEFAKKLNKDCYYQKNRCMRRFITSIIGEIEEEYEGIPNFLHHAGLNFEEDRNVINYNSDSNSFFPNENEEEI